ncbi:MAG TPA: EpsG family protein [Steroidobacteraceae bacterium]|nr:EpsG family protein [Steroidobacteraceae bacterium]
MNASAPTYAEEVNWTRLGKAPCLFLALGYGGTLAALPMLAFQDRENYLGYARHSLLLLGKFFLSGISATIANEPVWLLVNGVLGLMLSPEVVVRLLIFTSACAMSYVMLRRGAERGWGWMLLLLLMPQLVENYTTHITQGCAIAVFLAGWFSVSKFPRWLLLGLAPLIHSSYFVVLALYVMTETMKKLRLAEDVQVAAIVATGAVMSVGFVWAASVLGARQGTEYQDVAGASVSGIGFVFWLLVLLLLFLEGRSLLRRNALAVTALVFYLATYFFLQFTGRIFESMMALAIVAGLQLTSWRRAIFLLLSVSWLIAGWILELTQVRSL